MQNINEKVRKNALVIILLVLVACVPFIITDTYFLKVIGNVMIYAVIAMSVNLLTGFTGQVDFGRCAFMGIGAYFSGLTMMKLGFPFLIAFAGAGIFSALMGAVLGGICRRISFDYLTLITIGFNEICRIVFMNWTSVTNGSKGMPIDRPKIFGFTFSTHESMFYFAFVLLVLSYIIIRRITKSKIGRSYLAIKGDEIAAAYSGINVAKVKMECFIVASFFTGLAGAALAHYSRFLSPANYSLDESLIILQMAILGGLGSLPGSILGAAILIVFPEVSRTFYDYRLAFMGIMMVLFMLYLPNGILGRNGIADKLKGLVMKRHNGDKEGDL